MRLWGAATTSTMPSDAARWLLDGDEVAQGLDAFITAPKPGEHRATLIVKAPDGTAEVSLAFTTIEFGEERDED
ncbi:hypothetical protein OM076_42650 [Solirubrobacter ginsenosidimutans]|uniref:Uncharacterized protein n=1 Tax=Solirubrobacter ginsenosidimutans TaxID=490573 RepID=A0A9X3SBK0_9ACTN|nr:hypothetical protein [Solirubrobacter ginsenosidimutans]MDA0167038.1 hypothetical protein [Solirubrobacter ginsenosidimutans]